MPGTNCARAHPYLSAHRRRRFSPRFSNTVKTKFAGRQMDGG